MKYDIISKNKGVDMNKTNVNNEYVSFNFKLPKSETVLVDLVNLIIEKSKKFNYQNDSKDRDRVDEFKELFGDLKVKEIPTEYDLTDIRLKRYE